MAASYLYFSVSLNRVGHGGPNLYSPSTWDADTGLDLEFEASLGYIVHFRPIWATKQEAVSNKTQTETKAQVIWLVV